MKQKIRHDYTNEVELKSLLIRERNNYYNIGTQESNSVINLLIQEYKQNKSQETKERIIKLSQETKIDKDSHNKFGEIVLLMIKKILTKPNFSGYSWTDEFYSVACYRVFKYLHNFDFQKKSVRTNNQVSAFSYITQIITMSILEVINKHNKLAQDLNDYMEKYTNDYDIPRESKNSSNLMENIQEEKDFIIDYNFKTLKDELPKILKDLNTNIKIFYPKDYRISYDEYAEISKILKNQKHLVSLIKLEF